MLRNLDAPEHKRDLAVWRLYGAVQVIASGDLAGVEPGQSLAALRRVVAECNDEIAALRDEAQR